MRNGYIMNDMFAFVGKMYGVREIVSQTLDDVRAG